MVNAFWAKMPFRLRLKSYEGNCAVCWKKSLRKLLTLAKQDPSLFDFEREMEQEYENYIPESRTENKEHKPPFRFFRGNLSVAEIIELSKLPFEPAIDESQVTHEYVQTTLFGHELDIGQGCSESCR